MKKSKCQTLRRSANQQIGLSCAFLCAGRGIVFAVAVGFLLVTIFYRGGSLLPCIIVHSAINTLGTVANDANPTTEMHLLHLAALIVITVAYTLILTRTLPQKQWKEGCKNE